MKWFSRPEPVNETPEEASTSVALNEYHFNRIFQTSKTSPERIAAVFACANVIASSIAAMPLHLYRRAGATRTRADEHRVARLLSSRPNAVTTWKPLREATLYNLIMTGRAYWRVYRQGGFPVEIYPLDPDLVRFTIKNRAPRYEFATTPQGVEGGVFGAEDIAHFRNLCGPDGQGISPISHCRATMNAASSLQAYGETSAAKGQPLKGVVTGAPPSKNREIAKRIRENWRASLRESQAEGDGVVIIEGERMQFHQVSMSMRDAQFIEQMQFSVVEIARIFNVPPHKIQELENATYSNIEHQSIEFYTSTLVPWIDRIEEVLNHSLLTEADRRNGYYFKHNADGLLRGDIKTRMEANSAAIMSGQMTPNEARALEDREPRAGGDRLLVGVNQTPLENLGTEPSPPNE